MSALSHQNSSDDSEEASGIDSDSDATDFELDAEDECMEHSDEDGDDEEDSSSQGESQPISQSYGITNWNLDFLDDAREFQANTHAVITQLGFNDETTPYEILRFFIDEQMVTKILEESNRYAEQKGRPMKNPWTKEDFWRFLAVNFAMGIDKKPSMNDYWAKNEIMFSPFFGNTMPRERFWELLGTLHFANNRDILPSNTNRFAKMGTFMESLIANFKKAIHPGEYLCLDESLVPFKGRLSIKQYTPKKRTRFGVKLFILADCSTKFVIDFIPYQGKHTQNITSESVNLYGFGGATVQALLESYHGKYHRVVVDNWFMSPFLARSMKAKGTYMIGTVQKRRKGMPDGPRMKRKLKKGEIEVFSDGSLLVERWHDNREVCMLNTFLPHSMQEWEARNPSNTRDKPGSVLVYNAKMGAVDEADKTIKPYKNQRKSYKWYRKVAFHLVDIAVYNSFLVYRQLNATVMPYKKFLETIILEILSSNPQPSRTVGRPRSQPPCDRFQGNHFPLKCLKPNGKPSKSDCTYCRIVLKKRKTTSFCCMKCNKRLCIGGTDSCFVKYHTDKIIRKRRRIRRGQNAQERQATTSQASVRDNSISILNSGFSQVHTNDTESSGNFISTDSGANSISLLSENYSANLRNECNGHEDYSSTTSEGGTFPEFEDSPELFESGAFESI